MMAGWLRTDAHRPRGDDHRDLARWARVLLGVSGRGDPQPSSTSSASSSSRRPAAVWPRRSRTSATTCSPTRSCTAATAIRRPCSTRSSRDLDWDPPRIMSTAFLWYINEASMLDDLEGWVGVDQVGDEVGDPNPNFWPTMNRFERRFGRQVLHAMVGCTYDQTRAALAGVAAAELLDARRRDRGTRAADDAADGDRRPSDLHQLRAVRPQGPEGRLADAAPGRRRRARSSRATSRRSIRPAWTEPVALRQCPRIVPSYWCQRSASQVLGWKLPERRVVGRLQAVDATCRPRSSTASSRARCSPTASLSWVTRSS